MFASSFNYESIPTSILPTVEHLNAAKRACDSLETFLTCDHDEENRNFGFEQCCSMCTSVLQKKIGKDSFFLPSVERLVSCPSEAQEEFSCTPVRAISYLVSKLLQRCIDVSTNFNTAFKKAETRSAREYNAENSYLPLPLSLEATPP